MNLIRIILLAGGIGYTALFIAEFMQGHVFWQAILGAGVTVLISLLPFSHDEEHLHTGEMALLWICILLFGLYAILKSGGLV